MEISKDVTINNLKKTNLRLKIVIVILIVACFISVGYGFVQRKIAEENLVQAVRQRLLAVQASEEADRQRKIAEQNAMEAMKQQKLAEMAMVLSEQTRQKAEALKRPKK